MDYGALYVLQVVGGEEHGTRFVVDERPRVLGRARDADLILRDLGVSRRHVVVLATEEGVKLDVLEGATPMTINGRALRTAIASAGDRILLGNTVVEVVIDPPSGRSAARADADVRTILTGVGADARAMAALYALIGALDAAPDEAAVCSAVVSWSAEQVPVCSATLRRSPEHVPSTIVGSAPPEETALISVPAPCHEPTWLDFRITERSAKLTDSFRRMLILAGRLAGSALSRVHHASVAQAEVEVLRSLSFGSARAFLGTSPAATYLASLIPRLAASEVGVLLQGETGVGKTFVGRLIHEGGSRAREPLKVINCAAIPENLVESELFGHERGAFTGAGVARIGALEAAGKGTLLLDEVGELSLGAQSKLLRVLEDKEFERIGSNRSLALQARVICATNRDLEAMIAARTFRSDLFFRISVVRAYVPALRERGDDIVLLARQILADAARSAGRRIDGFSPAALEAIRSYSWPGNVRELRNAVEHAVALGDAATIAPADLPAGIRAAPVQPEDGDLVRLPLSLTELERRGVEAAMRHTKGNRTRAAALLGISRPTLNSRLNAALAIESDP